MVPTSKLQVKSGELVNYKFWFMPICKLQVTKAEIITYKENLILTNIDKKIHGKNFVHTLSDMSGGIAQW